MGRTDGQHCQCTACKLCKTGPTPCRASATAAVVDGDRRTPGEQEDKRGEPFVGKAGQFARRHAGRRRQKRGDSVYIANVIKCRPPGNRNPEPDEIAACAPYLRRQIALAQPKLLLAPGKFSAQTLLNREIAVGAMRASGGQLGRFGGGDLPPVLPAAHPTGRPKAWDDLMKACTLVP